MVLLGDFKLARVRIRVLKSMLIYKDSAQDIGDMIGANIKLIKALVIYQLRTIHFHGNSISETTKIFVIIFINRIDYMLILISLQLLLQPQVLLLLQLTLPPLLLLLLILLRLQRQTIGIQLLPL